MSTNKVKNNNEGEEWMFALSRIAAIYWHEEDATTLRRIRESKNISLRELTDMVNESGCKCSYNSLHKLETMQVHRTNPKVLKAVADALNVKLYELVPSFLFLGQKNKYLNG